MGKAENQNLKNRSERNSRDILRDSQPALMPQSLSLQSVVEGNRMVRRLIRNNITLAGR